MFLISFTFLRVVHPVRWPSSALLGGMNLMDQVIRDVLSNCRSRSCCDLGVASHCAVRDGREGMHLCPIPSFVECAC